MPRTSASRSPLVRCADSMRMPSDTGEPFTQQHMDFAAGLQHMLETIALHLIGHFARSTGLANLCLSGGVAHNCTLNGKLLRSGMFERMFVQPAAHDAGNALGAALGAVAGSQPKVVPDRVGAWPSGPYWISWPQPFSLP